MKKLLSMLLLLPMLCDGQYVNEQDSLEHMKQIKNNYDMVQNDVGCMYANGTTALGITSMYMVFISTARNNDSPQKKVAVIGGGLLVALVSYTVAITNRKKHAAKYRLYQKYYD